MHTLALGSQHGVWEAVVSTASLTEKSVKTMSKSETRSVTRVISFIMFGDTTHLPPGAAGGAGAAAAASASSAAMIFFLRGVRDAQEDGFLDAAMNSARPSRKWRCRRHPSVRPSVRDSRRPSRAGGGDEHASATTPTTAPSAAAPTPINSS